MEKKTILTIEDHLDGDRILIRTAFWEGTYKSYEKVLIDNIGPRMVEDLTGVQLSLMALTEEISLAEQWDAMKYLVEKKGDCPKWLTHVVHQTRNPDA